MKSFVLLACLAMLMLPGIVVAQTDAIAEQMQWFKDAKFGMFIHFQAPRSGDFNPVISIPPNGCALPRPG